MDCLLAYILNYTLESIPHIEGATITNYAQKTTTGITLIEIMIVITILGIILIFGGNYLVSILQEHRICVQNYYLQREASFALDSIINGRMIEENGKYLRTSGIINAHDANIISYGSAILLYNDENDFIGRIFTSPDNNPQSIFFDEDQDDNNGNEHRIIPRGSSEAAIQDPPYEIETDTNKPLFDNNSNNPDLIYIRLRLNQKLKQETNGRNLEVVLNSAVELRN